MTNEFRRLPSVDNLLSEGPIQELLQRYPHHLIAESARLHLEEARLKIASGASAPSSQTLAEQVVADIEALGRPNLMRIINATGVIIHTNLGRAPLSRAAMEAVEDVSRSYSNLEFDLEAGERGFRHSHLEALLSQLTGAEAGFAVNNNAAALLLGLSALAQDKEVIVSRGQAVEIGGGFRIPDVLGQSGARLVEVGTTNRTYARDYENAITEETAALLRVHTSNFRVIGFTHEVPLEEMVELAHRRNVLLLDDIGSGCLLDTTQFGLGAEPTPQKSLAQGSDLTFFSGDKLLGGPQAGVVVGKRALVDKLRRHPLARAFRIDKLSLAALTTTLLHYLRGEAQETIPIWQMVSMSAEKVESRAKSWAKVLGEAASVVDGKSMIGGGSLPEESIPTAVLAITGGSAEELARCLRANDPPIVGRIENDTLLLDPRTVMPEDDALVVQALKKLIAHG
jgi:L-seryl-tRNA(Ser) seleniumtransferase